jgi:hypothetical protein
MKRVMREIDVIAWFDNEGNITPLKFKLPSEGETEAISVKIDQVVHKTMERFAGNTMIVFECQSMINDVLRRYQVKYEVEKQKWFLYKI